MANPLKKSLPEPPQGSFEYDDLLSRCHAENFTHSWVRGNRWHYVEPANADRDHPRIAIVDGLVADEIWRVLSGEKLQYKNWSLPRLQAAERACRSMIERGMVPA